MNNKIPPAQDAEGLRTPPKQTREGLHSKPKQDREGLHTPEQQDREGLHSKSIEDEEAPQCPLCHRDFVMELEAGGHRCHRCGQDFPAAPKDLATPPAVRHRDRAHDQMKSLGKSFEQMNKAIQVLHNQVATLRKALS